MQTHLVHTYIWVVEFQFFQYLKEQLMKQAAKDVSMHIAAINPKYVSRDQVDASELEHEREVLKQQALKRR